MAPPIGSISVYQSNMVEAKYSNLPSTIWVEHIEYLMFGYVVM
jgi:hypothetical protein